ncbi:hypothetical protein J2X97_000167 [Epilithonimonas hungarica]|uniref:hypothetical protein n=1 Tax=Epilithonimonas hungarica TaxID=454006 RepID=UPI00277E6580|nr:hypothetical protein [Epilithonimonas hungarica]MDP9954530.1 hypothetical protein [Epilithonimonas hungarica]
MENSQIERLFNQTFSGLTLFYRDTNLDETLFTKYVAGQILQERGFIDMSFKGGGLTTNIRYLIASTNGKDVSSLVSESKNFGHTMLKPNSFFKVLDIYKIENKTQILLLEIPEIGINLFKSSISNIEEQVIEKARESFESKIKMEPIPELQEADWKQKTEFPIGMNDKGEFFFQDEKDTSKIKINSENQKKPWWKLW